jgi:hypothetical protein
MKKILLTTLLSGLVGTASAQSAFEGFYGQIATGYENNTIKSSTTTFSAGTGNTLYSNPASIANSAPIVFGAGYNFSINPQFLLGIGADYSFLTAKSATTVSTSPGADNNVAYAKISNRYNIFIAPGYVIDKNSLAYLKMGYSSQKIAGYSADDNSAGPSVNVNGYILGLGYKQMISSGLYAFGEGNYMGYMSKNATQSFGTVTASTPTSASAFNFLIGVGYKF